MYILTLSSLFLAVAIFFYKKNSHSVISRVTFNILVVLSLISNLLYVVSNYFTGNGITDAVKYYLSYSMKHGLTSMGLLEYRWLAFLVILIVAAVIVFLQLPSRLDTHKTEDRRYSYLKLPFVLIIIALLLSPSAVSLYDFSVFSLEKETLSSTGNFQNSENFFDYYRYPTIQQIGKRKNLVFIYAESFEQIYSDEEVFPGLTPGLNSLAKRGTSFTNIQQLPGTGFTMGGMVASQCGISLFGIPYGNSMSGMDAYLPAAKCLGDLLHREKYFLSYLGGADEDFAGKGLFYKDHGFDEEYGYNELAKMLSDSRYKTSWGLYDDTLLDLSYNHFIELSAKKNNFALFLLTLDTHQPNEAPSKSCTGIKYKSGDNKTLNAIACSDFLISKFANQILNSKYAKDTVIVIASDHLAPHDPTAEFDEYVERSGRLLIISPDVTKPSKVTKIGSTLDTGSTVLPFVGFNATIGLGRNLLDTNQSNSEIVAIHQNMVDWVQQFMSFWNFPKIESGIQIDPDEGYVSIEDRKFELPTLIEIDENMQTTLKFQFGLELSNSLKKGEWELTSQVMNIDKNKSFMLIDSCKSVQKIKENSFETDYCLVAGKGPNYSILPVKGIQNLTTDEIKKLIKM